VNEKHKEAGNWISSNRKRTSITGALRRL